MIYNLLAKSAASFADRIAVVDKKKVLTYSQLITSIEETTILFRNKEIRPGDTIAIHINNSLEFILSLFTAAKLGTNILLLDATLKPEEIDTYLKRTASSFLVTAPPLNYRNDSNTKFKDTISLIYLPTNTTKDKNEDRKKHVCKTDPPSAACYLLSSGSTGIPKIIVRRSEQVLAAITIFQGTLPYNESDNVLALLPFTHSFGFLNVLLTTLSCGAALYIESFSPRSTASAIRRHGITVLPATPFIFRMLNDTHFQTTPDFSSLRIAISAGSALPMSTSKTFNMKFGIPIFQSYGTTETGPAAIACLDDDNHQPGWVGKPYKSVTFDILGPNGDLLPPGKEGQLAVKSPANTEGYLNHPRANREIFTHNAILTGDVGFQDDSENIFVLGRERPMINVSGKKVSPAEVEACIRNHANVTDVVVFGENVSTGDEIVKAVIVPSGDVTALEIREFCTKKLADFKAPRSIEFVKNLSHGSMGKARYASTKRNT